MVSLPSVTYKHETVTDKTCSSAQSDCTCFGVCTAYMSIPMPGSTLLLNAGSDFVR